MFHIFFLYYREGMRSIILYNQNSRKWFSTKGLIPAASVEVNLKKLIIDFMFFDNGVDMLLGDNELCDGVTYLK